MKFVYGILALLALVVAALFLVPTFLDWERFKPEISERLEAITGREVAIDGAVAVSILPVPKITVADLRIANVPGAAAAEMARIKSVDLALALGPLLGGEIAVTSLEFIEPVIELERSAGGQPNWLYGKAAGEVREGTDAGEAEPAALEPARIDSTTITNGTIVFRHGDGRAPERIERIDAVLSARSLDGPFRADGTFTVRGRAIVFQLATGTISEGRSVPVSLEATVGGERGTALFEGTVTGIDGAPSFDGTVRIQAPDLDALLTVLDIDHGTLPAAPLATAFSAKGDLSASAEAVAARALQLRLGESQASGGLSWRGGDVPSFDAKIALNRIDLDQYLPAAGTANPGGAEREQGAEPAADLRSIPAYIQQAIPGDITATVDFTIDALTWREGVIRQARAQLALDGGAVTIRHASVLLPGGADVSLAGRVLEPGAGGDGPWLKGAAEIEAGDLRAILSWLDVDAGAVPADRLRRFSASLDLSADDNWLSASNLDVRVDTTRIAGDASIETGERPRLTARLSADAVNLDAYLLPAVAPLPPDAAGEAAAAQATGTRADDGTWAALKEIDADVTLAIDSLIHDEVRLAGLNLDAAIEDGNVTLRGAQVADAAGMSLSMTGTAHMVWSAPVVALDIDGTAESLAGLTALLDIDPDIRTEAFGAITLRGTLEGDREALTVDLALATANAEASLAGTIEKPFGTPAAALALGLRASDAAALARTAGLTPPPVVARLGALAIDGGIGGDLDSLAINLSAEVAGAALQVAGKLNTPLAAPSYSVDVNLDHPSAETLVETLAGGGLDGATLGALRLAATVSGNQTATDIADIDAEVGDSRVSGGVFLRLDQEPPAISADLRASVLDLAWLGGGLAAAGEAEDSGDAVTAPEDVMPGPGRWSDEAFDFAVLDRLSGTLALDADTLRLGAYRIEQATLDLAAADGTLTVRSLRGRLFDGSLEADGSLTGGSEPSGRAAFRLGDADIGAALLEAAGVDAISGKATIEGDIALRGRTAREMIGNLTGRVDITSREGAIDGVDLPAISNQIGALAELDTLVDIPSFLDQAEQSLSSGRTALLSLDGAIVVQDGQARIESFRIVADGATGDIAGTADLPAWQVDLAAAFRLVAHPEAPPVGVRLEGPIEKPSRRYMIEDMQAHLLRLGLLSLARSQDAPTINIRKGAKAEPGTEMDTLLRDVFGDPEEADDAPPTEETREFGGTDEAEDATPPEADTAGTDEVEDATPPEADAADTDEPPASPPPVRVLDKPAVAEEAAPAEETEDLAGADEADRPAGAEQAEEAPAAAEPVVDAEDDAAPAAAQPTVEAAEPAEEDTEGESAAPPPADGPAPEAPPTPEPDRGDAVRSFVDDLLRSLEEE